MNNSPLSWLLMPYYAVALATGAKSFRDNPLIGSPALNERGLHVGRVRIAHAMADARRRRLRHLAGEDAPAFDRDGFVIRRDFLPADQFDTLRSAILSCRGPARDMIQGDAVTRRIPIDADLLGRVPALRTLTDHPRWRGLISYVGSSRAAPRLYLQTIFSQARDAEPDPQTHLHADTFHPTVKAWFFINDVAEEDGPFVYVPGSHRASPRRLAWEREMSLKIGQGGSFLSSRGSPRISAEELRRLGFGKPRLFAVPANTLVVADTFGFHARGLSARPSTRVAIWAYGRRNPFLPWTGLDPLSIPMLRDRATTMLWRAMDLRQRLGIRPNNWRRAGLLGPETPPDLKLFER